MSGMPVQQSLSERLWQDSHVDVMRALHHPFVRSLGAGTLAKYIFYQITRWVKNNDCIESF